MDLIVLLPSSHTLLGSPLPSTQSPHSGQHSGGQHHRFWRVYPMSLLPSPTAPKTILFTCFYFVVQLSNAWAELVPA